MIEEANKFVYVTPDPRIDLKRLSIYYDNTVITPNICLVPILPNHYQYLASIYMDKDIMKYFGLSMIKNENEIRNTILQKAKANANAEGAKGVHWLIVVHGGAAGQVGIMIPTGLLTITTNVVAKNSNQLSNILSSEKKIIKKIDSEIYYALSKSFHGKGIAAKASKLAIDFFTAFLNKEHNKQQFLYATVHPDNFPSINLLTKLGFVIDKITGYGGEVVFDKYNAPRKFYKILLEHRDNYEQQNQENRLSFVEKYLKEESLAIPKGQNK